MMGPNERIPVFTPIIGAEETEYINDCLRTHWVSQGRYVTEFESAFSEYSGAKHGVAACNGTTALHMAGLALGIGAGDEVLVSTSTNMASAFSMHYCGARPVPVDIELSTWQMDVTRIEEKITPRTKAIMVVHLFGHPVDMDPVLEIAKRHNLFIIEDCAQAHGAEYKGRRVGSIGDIGCFSFYANKIITCGEGGMAVTNSPDLVSRLRKIGNFYYGEKQKFLHEDIGYNYRMSNVSAAMGLGQFERIDAVLARKKEIHRQYLDRLQDIKSLHLPETRSWVKNVMWMFNAKLDPASGVTLQEFMDGMTARNIETREAFVPINRQTVFIDRGWVTEEECPIANDIMDTGFYLPSGLTLTEAQVTRVCDSVRELLGC